MMPFLHSGKPLRTIALNDSEISKYMDIAFLFFDTNAMIDIKTSGSCRAAHDFKLIVMNYTW